MVTASAGASADRQGDFWNPMEDCRVPVYLEPGLGRTDVAAAVANPSDLSAAGWTISGTSISARTATTITDSTDVATAHYISQTAANVTVNHVATVTFTVPAGSTQYIALSFDNDAARVILDTVAGTIAYQTAWDATATYVGGVFTGLRKVVTNGGIRLYTANGTAWANTSYNGASSIVAAFTKVDVSQVNVSAHASQKGTASLVQATAANRPQILQIAGADGQLKNAIYTDGVNDYYKGAIAGLVSPVTVVWWGKFAAAWGSVGEYVFDASTVNGMRLVRDAAARFLVAAGVAGFNVTACDEINWHCWGAVFRSSGTGELWRDGTMIGSGTIGVLTPDGLTVGSAGSGGNPSSTYTLGGPLIYQGAGDAAFFTRCRRFGQRRGWGP